MGKKVSNEFSDTDFDNYFIDQFEQVRLRLREMDGVARTVIEKKTLERHDYPLENGATEILKIVKRATMDLFVRDRRELLPEKYTALALRVSRFRRRREKESRAAH